MVAPATAAPRAGAAAGVPMELLIFTVPRRPNPVSAKAAGSKTDSVRPTVGTTACAHDGAGLDAVDPDATGEQAASSADGHRSINVVTIVITAFRSPLPTYTG